MEEVQEIVERHLKDLIIKNFDPKKADSIFTGTGQVNPIIIGFIMQPLLNSDERKLYSV